MLAPEILTAVIGAVSAFVMMAIRDVVMSIAKERRIGQRHLLQRQIEQAYAPLEYLVVTLLRTDDPAQKASLVTEIGTILRQHSYLLSERTVSALYTLLDDEAAGAHLLNQHFFTEFEELKRIYYRTWFISSRQQPRLRWSLKRPEPQGGVNLQALIQ